MERDIRRKKREFIGYDRGGLRDEYEEAAMELADMQKEYARFSEASGLLPQTDRLGEQNYGRREAAKATYAVKKNNNIISVKPLKNTSDNDIITIGRGKMVTNNDKTYDIIYAKQFTLEQRLNTFKSKDERVIAEYLENKGRVTIANDLEGVEGAGRQGDSFVNGVKTEFKTLSPKATSTTIKNEVNNSIRRGGQARNIVIDARNSALTKEEAEQGVFKALGISRGKIDYIEVIGEDYFFGYAPKSK